MIVGLGLALAQVPPVLSGVWDVTAMTEGGGTPAPFAEVMRRRALAGGDDCVVARRSFDFGEAPEGAQAHRPAMVAISEEVRCKKGGLGEFLSEATLLLDATWTEGDPLTLSVPGGNIWITMTRIQKPRDVGVPAQWSAPEVMWSVDPSSYAITAEKVYGKKVPPLELSDGQNRYKLEMRQPPR